MADQNSKVSSSEKGSSRFAILKIRNFRYYWGATIFSLTGEHIEVSIRHWLIWELTHSVDWLLVMVFMHWFPHTLLSLPAGSIADRVNRQQLILWSEIGLCAAALGMFITTYLGIMDQYWMSALLILHSVAGSISAPSRQLFVHDMVGRENLLAGVAMTSSLRFATQAIGKPIGGIVLLVLGASYGFFVNTLTFLPLILVLLTVIRIAQREVPPESRRHPYEEFKQGLRHMRTDRSILAIICIATAPSIFLGNGFDAFLPIYADTVFSMGKNGYTYFLTAQGVGAFVAVVALASLGNVRWKGKMVFVGIFVYCISIFAFAFSNSFALSITALFIFGISQVIYSSSATALVLERVPSEMRGRIMGIFNFSRLGLRVLNGPFLIATNKLAILSTATAFTANAITLSIASGTVILLTLGFAFFLPGVIKQDKES